MNNLFFTLMLCGLISCSNQNSERVKINQVSPPNESVSTSTTDPTKSVSSSFFKTNIATEISKYINCIFQDNSNNYWFASNAEGIYFFDGKSLIQFTTKDGICDNQVFTIQEDKQSNLWFLTAGGISCFDGKTFVTFPNKDKPVVRDLDIKTGSDDLWFEVSGGAYRFNGNSFSYVLLPKSDLDPKHFNPTNPQNPDSRKLNKYSAYCSLKDKAGNIWFGTQTLGVCRYDGKDFTWLSEKGLSGPAVRAIFEDSNGYLWFGNNGNGLFKYDGKSLVNFTGEKGLGNPEFLKTGKSQQGTLARVWSINEDNNKNIWIGTTDAGAWCYDGKTLKNYTANDGLTSNAVNTIYKDKKGELWFGTDGGGVCKFNGNFSAFKIKS